MSDGEPPRLPPPPPCAITFADKVEIVMIAKSSTALFIIVLPSDTRKCLPCHLIKEARLTGLILLRMSWTGGVQRTENIE